MPRKIRRKLRFMIILARKSSDKGRRFSPKMKRKITGEVSEKKKPKRSNPSRSSKKAKKPEETDGIFSGMDDQLSNMPETLNLSPVLATPSEPNKHLLEVSGKQDFGLPDLNDDDRQSGVESIQDDSDSEAMNSEFMDNELAIRAGEASITNVNTTNNVEAAQKNNDDAEETIMEEDGEANGKKDDLGDLGCEPLTNGNEKAAGNEKASAGGKPDSHGLAAAPPPGGSNAANEVFRTPRNVEANRSRSKRCKKLIPPTPSAETFHDPNRLVSFFVCPLCKDAFGSEFEGRAHIMTFHCIQLPVFDDLGLSMKEWDVKTVLTPAKANISASN